MGSVSSTKGSTIVQLQESLALTDREASVLLTEEEIEEKKTKTLESLRENLKILSDINGHLIGSVFFDEEFKEASHNLHRNTFALEKASLKVSEQFSREFGDEFVELGGVKIVCDVVVYCQKKLNDYEENEFIKDLILTLANCITVLLNFTDANHKHSHLLVEHGEYLPQASDALRRKTSSHLDDSLPELDNTIIQIYIGVVHNIAQSEQCNDELREIGFVDVLLPYLKSQNETIFLLTLAVLAELVDDSEAKLLETDAHFFAFLLKCLNTAINERRRRYNGWSARELARTIRRIAKNDGNKKSLVTQGSLPVLVSLTNSGREDEQIEAFGALWVLSFDKDNQKIMLKDDAVMEAFKKFRTSHNIKINNACNGALWNMREKLRTIKKYKELANQTKEHKQNAALSTSNRGHVMISYQWKNQKLIQKIRDRLQENGVKCWMDIDDMQGSTLYAMAKAVEDADIVLICYSRKYHESPNCRAEAEYAFQLRKLIIPLKMELNFDAREWLGLIIGTKLIFEFTDKYPFEEKMSGLLKEIFKIHQEAVPQKPAISKTVSAYTEVTTASSAKPRINNQELEVVRNWTENDVLRWKDHHKLPSSMFSSMTGMDIVFLQVLRQECPEFFYKALQDMLKLNDVPTMAKFCFALENTSI